MLGDPDEFDYENPLTFGIGIGKTINKGKIYTSAYYQQYTRIIEDLDKPRQLSIGISYRINSNLFFSVSWIKGFSETSPDRGLIGGFQVKI